VSDGLSVLRPGNTGEHGGSVALSIVKCGQNKSKLCIFYPGHSEHYSRWPDPTPVHGRLVDLGKFDSRDPWARAFVERVGNHRVFSSLHEWEEVTKNAAIPEEGRHRQPSTIIQDPEGYVDMINPKPPAKGGHRRRPRTHFSVHSKYTERILVPASYITSATVDDCVEFTRRGIGGSYPLKCEAVVTSVESPRSPTYCHGHLVSPNANGGQAWDGAMDPDAGVDDA